MNILGGIIGVVVGFLLIKYAVPITNNLGTIEWAEEHMRGGMAGTYSLYKIIGIVVIILSFLYMFGGINVLLAPLGTVFGGVKAPQ